MLEKYKNQYLNQNIQFVFIDVKGQIVESDQTFLKLKIGDKIEDVHPFFISISYDLFKETNDKILTFNCVHISYSKKDYITDVKCIQQDEGILLVIYDLTDHYLSYQKIAQARNESVIKSELVVLKNIELEEREKFKNRFIRNFSHELRNPLTSIISITNVLESTNLSTDQQRMLDFLKESNSNLKLLLDDILSLSMISVGKLQLKKTVYNLYDLFELIEFTYKSKSKQKAIEFILDLDNKVPKFVEGDHLRLFQVITNLLDNALKFTVKGNFGLRIRLNQKRANKANIGFEVFDTGVGIPKEKQVYIFESFSQLKTNGKEQGSGLGLSIVMGLLNLMESKINIESSTGKGSIFKFDLSLKYQMNLGSENLKVDDSNKKIQEYKTKRKYKILLVEDDERVQTVLFKSLLDTNLFYIDLINDGSLVIETVMNNDYDAILMDVDLPNITGDQLTKLIRELPFKNIKGIPIIGITATAFADSIADFKAKGMNDVITKPFDLNQVVKTILKPLEK